MELSSPITFLCVDVPSVSPFRVIVRVSTRDIVVAALSPYFVVISAASPDLVENRLNAVAAAPTIDRTRPRGLALTAMLNRSIASLALRTLFARERNAETLPHITDTL